jgi:hypothetical protein
MGWAQPIGYSLYFATFLFIIFVLVVPVMVVIEIGYY